MFSEYLFHPSSLGRIMTEPRSKSDGLGETCKSHLMECYVSQKYGREKDITNQYIEKGLIAEEDSFDLYSVVKGEVFVKNTETFRNAYFVGTPDIVIPKMVIDIKTSWDIFTFFNTMTKSINKDYYWQLQAYMDLTGSHEAKLVYCLVNTPLKLLEDQKRKLLYTMAVIDPEVDVAYLDACQMIDKNSTFDDIPMKERYIEFTIPRDWDAIDRAHNRVIECREFLNNLNNA